MKATVAVALQVVLCFLSTTGIAIPIRGIREFQIIDSFSPTYQGSFYHILGARQEVSNNSIPLPSSMPVIGPFIQPLDFVLQSAKIAGPSATALDIGDLTSEQIAMLADIEALIYYAVANLTTKAQTANSTSPASAAVTTPGSSDPSDSTDAESSSDGLTLETRGLLDLGSLLAGLPIIGPILAPLIPLLNGIGLGSSSIASIDDVKSITIEQATTLARLELNLANAISKMNIPSHNTTTSSTSISPTEPAQL